ncbi:MAG: PASTA domain-containing protein [Bacteroidota bacterium]|jgi:serine/threonine-protein kinase
MKTDRLKKLVKPCGIVVFIGLIFFFLFDSILMPLYVQKGKTTKVPDVIGLSLEDAKQKIKEAGLDPKEAEYKNDKRYKIGTVVLQNPVAESEVKRNRGVYLTISGGEELVDVPNLKGKSVREAAFNLENYNLKLGTISYEPSEEIFANTIIRQEIQPGAKIRSGNIINVTVSQGRSTDKHPVPDVSLKTLNEAEKILTDNGFYIGKTTYQTNIDILPNTILEQSPRAGELLQLGQPIDLIIAQKTDTKNKVEN